VLPVVLYVELGQLLENIVAEALTIVERSAMEDCWSFLDLDVEYPLETKVEEALAAAK